MKRYNIDGIELVKLNDIKEIIRSARKDATTWCPDPESGVAACNMIVRRIFIDDIKRANNQEEIDAILEMTGDFIVFRKGENKYDIKYFSGWYDGKATFSNRISRSVHFDYESKAEEIAEELKKRTSDEWGVCNMSHQAYEDNKRLLAAIFGPDEEGENEE